MGYQRCTSDPVIRLSDEMITIRRFLLNKRSLTKNLPTTETFKVSDIV